MAAYCDFTISTTSDMEANCHSAASATQRLNRRRKAKAVAATQTLLPMPLFDACIDACKCFADGYEWSGVDIDERVMQKILKID